MRKVHFCAGSGVSIGWKRELPIDDRRNHFPVTTGPPTTRPMRLLWQSLIVITSLDALIITWVIAARRLSLLLDRIHTVERESRPVEQMGRELGAGLLRINGLPMSGAAPMEIKAGAEGNFVVQRRLGQRLHDAAGHDGIDRRGHSSLNSASLAACQNTNRLLDDRSRKSSVGRHAARPAGVCAPASMRMRSLISRSWRPERRRFVFGNRVNIPACYWSHRSSVACGSGATCSTGWWRWRRERRVGAAKC